MLCIISLNGGWTADPERNKPGRDLGYTRYDIMAQGLGCHGEYVEAPEDIRPALERAQQKVDGMVALVNFKTDYRGPRHHRPLLELHDLSQGAAPRIRQQVRTPAPSPPLLRGGWRCGECAVRTC